MIDYEVAFLLFGYFIAGYTLCYILFQKGYHQLNKKEEIKHGTTKFK